MMSFLSHVSSCDWLSEADYWCPYCCRQEHFGVSELERGSVVVGQPSKESKTKKARDFFKRFGHIGRRNPILMEEFPSHQHDSPGELEGTTSYPIKPNMYTIDEMPEMDARVLCSCIRELDDTSPGTMRKRMHSITSPYRSRKSSLHTFTPELRASSQTLYPLEMPSPEPAYNMVELSSPDGYIRRPDDDGFPSESIGSHSVAPVFSESLPLDASLISPMSPAFTQSARQSTPTLVSLIASPVLKVDSPSYARQVGICVAPNEQHTVHNGETYALGGRTRAICWRAFSSLPVEHSNKLVAQARVNMYKQGAASTLAYVEALRQLLDVLKDLWQGCLKDWPDLCCHSAALEINSPLDDGLRGLKECLSGKLPTTLPDVLPLVYLGYACAYMCHSEDWSYAWDVFYQNVLQWGDAIADQQDRCRFLRIAELLWSLPQGSHQPTALKLIAEPLLEEKSKRPTSSKRSTLQMHYDNAMVPRQHHVKLMESPTPASELHALLVSGPVIECCSRFLDGKQSIPFSGPVVPYAGQISFPRADHSGAIVTFLKHSTPA